MTTRVQYTKLFNPQLIGSSAQLIYQLAITPASLELRGARLRFVNTGGSSTTFTAYAVPNGSSVLAVNEFAAGQTLAAGAFFDIDVPVLSIGDAIWASAGAPSVVTVHYMNGVLIQ